MEKLSVIALLTLFFASSFPSTAHAGPVYREDQIIVRMAKRSNVEQAQAVLNERRMEVSEVLIPELNLFLVKLKGDLTVQAALKSLAQNAGVQYAQPDHQVKLRQTSGATSSHAVTSRAENPNDPSFKDQWGLTAIHASDAWAINTGGKDASGQEIVIAVIDGGVDITHADLVPNLWVNRGEIPGNGKDDDGNGYVDDVNGWNAYNDDGVIPSATHGTHVSGIAGAKGNNSVGVSGVNWNVKIMPIAGASGYTSVIAKAYGYALKQKSLWLSTQGKKGANIVVTNSSFGVDYANCESGEYPVWNDLYNELGKVGILSAAATANNHVDVDTEGDVPSGCSSPYLVNVTNTTSADAKYSSAGFGKKSIHLGAPGTGILSCYPGDRIGEMTGTSMATPHVAGAIALLHSAASAEFNQLYRSNPSAGAETLKKILLENVDKIPALRDITVSEGRLNLAKAMQAISRFHR